MTTLDRPVTGPLPGGERLRVVVLGYIVRGPIGGMAWHHLNYVLGLHRLGHDVLFIEDSDDYPSCYDPVRHLVDTDPTCGIAFATRAFERLGLGERWCYYDAHANAWLGPAASNAAAFCRSADVLLNVSGVNPLRAWSLEVPIRALIDTDPVFTQVRHLNNPNRLAQARAHNRFMTFGQSISAGRSATPDDGLPWQPTRQPVVLDTWPAFPPNPNGPTTTIMQWDSYQTQQYAGVTYGMKSQSFETYRSLPSMAGVPLCMALGGADAPRQSLREDGWTLHDPMPISLDPWTYQQYIHDARAEFSIAKAGYVSGRCGWFSDRSACFLATGRPVVLQDTGFSEHLPTGEGLLTFDSLDGAVEALERLNRDYHQHCRAARRIAQTHFASDVVLTELLNNLNITQASRQAPIHEAAHVH